MSRKNSNPPLGAIVDLHIRCLPNSLISILGYRFTRQFYLFAEASESEHLDYLSDSGDLLGACVVSLRPSTLTRRLAKNTNLLWWAPLAMVKIPLIRVLWESLWNRDDTFPVGVPEVLLLFVAPAARSRGIGMRLIERCEAYLLDAGYDRYFVRVSVSQGEAAAKFYETAGFSILGSITHGGQRFNLFEKMISRNSIP